jgi:hypothetical protein
LRDAVFTEVLLGNAAESCLLLLSNQRGSARFGSVQYDTARHGTARRDTAFLLLHNLVQLLRNLATDRL